LGGRQSVRRKRIPWLASRKIVTYVESEIPLSQGIRGNSTEFRYATGILALLIVEEIKETIGDDLAADGATELIAYERLAGHSGSSC